jgi:hypothetical protein
VILLKGGAELNAVFEWKDLGNIGIDGRIIFKYIIEIDYEGVECFHCLIVGFYEHEN